MKANVILQVADFRGDCIPMSTVGNKLEKNHFSLQNSMNYVYIKNEFDGTDKQM